MYIYMYVYIYAKMFRANRDASAPEGSEGIHSPNLEKFKTSMKNEDGQPRAKENIYIQ